MPTESEQTCIVAIDGPAGSGKSTLARLLASKLGYQHVDTGAMYRAVAYQALCNQVLLSDENELSRLAETTEILFQIMEGVQRVLINGVDRSSEIRIPEVTAIVSEVSAIHGVRIALVQMQRRFAVENNIVMEGRDIGSVVFPNAMYKFFLTASPEERGKRRYIELKDKGVEIELNQVVKDIKTRDQLDSERDFAPLIKSEGAIEIDTTNLSIDEVLNKMLHWIV